MAFLTVLEIARPAKIPAEMPGIRAYIIGRTSLTGKDAMTKTLLPTRRDTLAGLAGLASGLMLARPALADDAAEARKLKPGEYSWQPELQTRGPVSIIVSIKEQLLHVHRRGVRIGVSTASTGKPGHKTPIGVFTILQKKEEHVSSIYGSEMPFMQRLTWSGIALHAGALPGYPASHGCVRLPLRFAELLYGVTRLGTPVVIANRFSDPMPVVSATLAGQRPSPDRAAGFAARSRTYLDGEPEPRPVTSVLVSRRDGHIIVLENGAIVAEGEATISTPERPFASEVFVLNGAAEGGQGLAWEAIGYDAAANGPAPGQIEDVIDRIHGPDDVAAAIAERIAPGMILIVTDDLLSPDTRSAGDFVVMTAEEAEK
jgi:hypothetical protein